MARYIVLHREIDGHYCIWSSYPNSNLIEAELYEAFIEAELGEEFIVLDSVQEGTPIVGVYTIERRVIKRETGALEKAWANHPKPKAYSQNIGDGAAIIRFV